MAEKIYPFTVGACASCVDGNGMRIYRIQKGTTRNGMCFKSWDNFHERPDRPCYQPELAEGTGGIWTREDFLELAEGDEKIAEFIFEGVDWQSPWTLMDESFREGEIKRCPECRKMYLTGGEEDCGCPRCASREVYVTVELKVRVRKPVRLTRKEYDTLRTSGTADGIGKLTAVTEAPARELFGSGVPDFGAGLPEGVEKEKNYSIVDDEGRTLVYQTVESRPFGKENRMAAIIRFLGLDWLP